MSAERDRNAVGPSPYTASVANSVLGRGFWGHLRMRRLMRLRDVVRRERPAPDPKLVQRRPLYIIAVVLILASALTRYTPVLICGLLTLGIAIVPELWYRYGLRGLAVMRETETNRIGFGQILTVPLTVENRKLLPLPMVETVDEFPEALTVLGARLGLSTRPGSALLSRGMRLWTYQRVRRRYYVRAIQRGAYTFGPTLARVTDPFGILTREELFETRRITLVHPLIAPLDRFDLTPLAIFGDHASRTRLLEDPLRVAGTREYAPGDDPRRVHWKATARMGTLQSKLLDPSTQRTMVIALDVRTFSRAQLGYDPELAELGISVAASVAAWAVERGYAVGLIANGAFTNLDAGQPEASARPKRPQSPAPEPSSPPDAALALPRLRLEPAARPEQLSMILDSLARVQLFGGAAMGPLLSDEMRSAPTGATLVYVGLESLVDVGTMIALRRIQQSGHAVSLVLTARDNDDPFAEAGASHNLHAAGLPIHYVGGRARWKALVAEALGDLPPRKATDVVSEEHLAAERSLIAEQRRARARWRDHWKSEETHAEPDQRRSAGDDDDGQAAASRSAAAALH